MRRFASVFAAAWTALALPASAQEPAGEPGPPAAEAPAAEAPPKRKPKPRPKPQAKSPAKPQPPAEDKAAPSSAQEAPQSAPIPGPAPGTALAATPFAAPPVACEPGQAVQYEGGPTGAKETGKEAGKETGKAAELWVTRSGTITIDNPLRPLTPDVTRVLQVVIGGKVATAYGPDFLSLRRGASPAVLEGTIGGPVRWDAAVANLPDTLPIHADSGQTLAEFRFRACGSAPTAKTLPAPKARRTTPTEAEMAAAAAKEAAASKEAAKANAAKVPRPDGLAPRAPGVTLPQGAIP